MLVSVFLLFHKAVFVIIYILIKGVMYMIFSSFDLATFSYAEIQTD